MARPRAAQPVALDTGDLAEHRASPRPSKQHQQTVEPLDPFAPASVYYGAHMGASEIHRVRTLSVRQDERQYAQPTRRGSHDVTGNIPSQFRLNVQETLDRLLESEDTDKNFQITIDDKGPKVIELGTAGSDGYRRTAIHGNYVLSNLLQELTLAQRRGLKVIVVDVLRLQQNPVDRLSRLIKHDFWTNLTRCIDADDIEVVALDTKDWTANPRPRIYIPRGDPEQYEYWVNVAAKKPKMNLDVQWLEEGGADDNEYVRDLNEAPGLLAIAMERVSDGGKVPNLRGLKFIVPGGRFNELYGWDSYMITLGLLTNGEVQICQSMVRHFIYCIKHYGKILNANRSYYLRRSQPPFLTDMVLRVHARLPEGTEKKAFLRESMLAAIKDYYHTWMSAPRYDPESGLSCYHPGGLGVPPETERTHFTHILQPFAEKHNLTIDEFTHKYNYGEIREEDLDEYLLHDRAVRESGHDTSYRLETVAAHLATVDLNSLLYKYEIDIARVIQHQFGDKLFIPLEWREKGQPEYESSASWKGRAEKRRATMNKLMWDDERGLYFDYHIKQRKHTDYESATTFWAMWAGVCSKAQASSMVEKAIPLFEEYGGLASGTEKSRGAIGLHRPSRQWDYPFGWAPQQILAWTGLQRYGFEAEAQRLAYRWVFMVTKAFVDFNGTVVEKYDVTRPIDPHKVTAEYGNQGADFKGVATEGFGWVNASYVIGLEILTPLMRRAIGAVTPWNDFVANTKKLKRSAPSTAMDRSESGAANIGRAYDNANSLDDVVEDDE